jgi:cation diffusion facilitator CzcD-associated flavoprotein CzcO
MEWAMMEWDAASSHDRARQLFGRGASVPLSYQHPPLYQAWAEREADVGNDQAAEELRGRFREVAKVVQRQGLHRQKAGGQ